MNIIILLLQLEEIKQYSCSPILQCYSFFCIQHIIRLQGVFIHHCSSESKLVSILSLSCLEPLQFALLASCWNFNYIGDQVPITVTSSNYALLELTTFHDNFKDFNIWFTFTSVFDFRIVFINFFFLSSSQIFFKRYFTIQCNI